MFLFCNGAGLRRAQHCEGSRDGDDFLSPWVQAKAHPNTVTNPDVPLWAMVMAHLCQGCRMSDGLSCGKRLSHLPFCVISAVLRSKYNFKSRCYILLRKAFGGKRNFINVNKSADSRKCPFYD